MRIIIVVTGLDRLNKALTEARRRAGAPDSPGPAVPQPGPGAGLANLPALITQAARREMRREAEEILRRAQADTVIRAPAEVIESGFLYSALKRTAEEARARGFIIDGERPVWKTGAGAGSGAAGKMIIDGTYRVLDPAEAHKGEAQDGITAQARRRGARAVRKVRRAPAQAGRRNGHTGRRDG